MARYCKNCGQQRSRDWKREHPERAKLHGSEQSIVDWRDRNNWNAYIKAWRKSHSAEYRAQNVRHVQEHRNRKKGARSAASIAKSTLIVVGLFVLAFAAQGCESLPHLGVTTETLDHFDWFLVRLTATFTLGAACLRLIFHEVRRLISETRSRQDKSNVGSSRRRRIQ